MTDLERLEEALDDWDDRRFWLSSVHWSRIVEAARAYADLLANGVEPDYEAAAEVYANHRPGVGPVTDRKRVRAIVDAAIGDRLLINPPTEEE